MSAQCCVIFICVQSNRCGRKLDSAMERAKCKTKTDRKQGKTDRKQEKQVISEEKQKVTKTQSNSNIEDTTKTNVVDAWWQSFEERYGRMFLYDLTEEEHMRKLVQSFFQHSTSDIKSTVFRSFLLCPCRLIYICETRSHPATCMGLLRHHARATYHSVCSKSTTSDQRLSEKAAYKAARTTHICVNAVRTKHIVRRINVL